jgi:hypothetical protein
MAEQIDPDRLYDPKSASAALRGISENALALMRHRSRGPAYFQAIPRGSVLYRGSDLIAWLERGRRTPANN